MRDAGDNVLDLTKCPQCQRPYRDDAHLDNDGDAAAFSRERSFVASDYFGMLAASRRATPEASGPNTPNRRFFQPALRSGRSRDVSGASGPPSGAQFVGSAPSGIEAQGISRSALSPGFFTQNFVEKRILGKGGNGVVLLVEHMMDCFSLGDFACKRIPVGDNHAWLEKVLLEVRLLQGISHPNLVKYHWVWLEDHQSAISGPAVPHLWILQDYCNGGDLHSHVLRLQHQPTTAERLKSRARRRSKGEPEEEPHDLRASKLSFDEIFAFFKDITSGLHHLHSKGYIHRDLKPSNCLLHHDGQRVKVLISDFGEVQVAGAKRGSTGATGTISYCAPEVLQRDTPDGAFGNFSTKSDIFSLGMIVYFCCFGRLPYSNADDINEENEDLDQLRSEIATWKGFDDRLRARPDLPERLYKYLKRLLSVDPNERPSTDDILESIRVGGTISDLDIEDGAARVSSIESPARLPGKARRPSAMLARPGLSTMSRQTSSLGAARSPSPTKARQGTQGGEHSRPTSPINGAIAMRPRKIELPPRSEEEPEPRRSPHLMLPPPPERPLPSRILRFTSSPSAIAWWRAALFAGKLAVLSMPCMPFAARAELLYPLLLLAAMDVGLLEFDFRRSVLLLCVHMVIVSIALQHGRLCQRPATLWTDAG